LGSWQVSQDLLWQNLLILAPSKTERNFITNSHHSPIQLLTSTGSVDTDATIIFVFGVGLRVASFMGLVEKIVSGNDFLHVSDTITFPMDACTSRAFEDSKWYSAEAVLTVEQSWKTMLETTRIQKTRIKTICNESD
jgi:hypothetical protein